MSLSQDTMIELMAYADDELAADDRARVAKFVASNEEAARVVASIVRVGEWTRAADEERTVNADIASQVMEQIERGPAVVDLATARAKRASRTRVVVGVFAFAAVAAALVILTRPPNEAPTAQTTPIATSLKTGAPSANPAPPELSTMAAAIESAQPPLGVEVGKIDSQSKDVSVFYLPAGSGENGNAPSVVIWLGDDPAAGGTKQ